MCLYIIHTGQYGRTRIWIQVCLTTKPRFFFFLSRYSLLVLNMLVFQLPTLLLMKDSVQKTSLMLWLKKGKRSMVPTACVSAGLPRSSFDLRPLPRRASIWRKTLLSPVRFQELNFNQLWKKRNNLLVSFTLWKFCVILEKTIQIHGGTMKLF